MPHFIIEHSSNLEQSHDLKQLGEMIRDAAEATGVFPLGGIRVRFHPCETYVIADGHPDNAFLSVIVRIGVGRDMETKKRAGQALFDVICDFFDEDLQGGHFMVSLDIDENVPDVSFKKNSVHGRLQGKARLN